MWLRKANQMSDLTDQLLSLGSCDQAIFYIEEEIGSDHTPEAVWFGLDVIEWMGWLLARTCDYETCTRAFDALTRWRMMSYPQYAEQWQVILGTDLAELDRIYAESSSLDEVWVPHVECKHALLRGEKVSGFHPIEDFCDELNEQLAEETDDDHDYPKRNVESKHACATVRNAVELDDVLQGLERATANAA